MSSSVSAVGETLAELGGFSAELFVGELLRLRFFCVDGSDVGAQAFQVTLVLRADDLCQESINNHQERRESTYLMIVTTEWRVALSFRLKAELTW